MGRHGRSQVGQRSIVGILAVAGILSVALLAVHGQYKGWPQVISGLFAIVGCYLFGYFAFRGRLPGKHLPKASAAIQQATSRHDV
jgi:uncharacterized membrane protein HdeD (DUF308 family)